MIDQQFQQALQYFQNGQFNLATPILEGLMTNHPDFPFAFNLAGAVAFQEKHYEKAENYFKRALSLHSESFDMYLNLGHLYATQGKLAQAIPHFESSLKLNPQQPDIVHQVVNYYQSQNQMEKAKHIQEEYGANPLLQAKQLFAQNPQDESFIEKLTLAARQPELEYSVLDFLKLIPLDNPHRLKALETFFELTQQHKAFVGVELGYVYCKNNELDKAKAIYKDLLENKQYKEAGQLGLQLFKTEYPRSLQEVKAFSFDLKFAYSLMQVLIEAELYTDSEFVSIHLKKILKYYEDFCQDLTDPTVLSANFTTPERTKEIYEEAFRRCFEYLIGSRVSGDMLEFGTYKGYTARIIAKCMAVNQFQNRLFLFDSFEGFPEIDSPVDQKSHDVQEDIWYEGIMALSPKVEKLIERALIKLIPPQQLIITKGYFEETFEKIIPQIKKPSLIHIDCDLYAATKYVLDKIIEHDLLQDGAIMLFDDFNCNKAHPKMGERRALKEAFAAQEHFDYSPFFTYGWHGQAFFIHDMRIDV